MTGNVFLPFFVFCPFLGALAIGCLGDRNEKLRDYLADALVIGEFLLMIAVFLTKGAMFCSIPGVCGMGLTFRADSFRAVYGMLAAFMWMMTTILSREYFEGHQNVTRFYVAMLLTYGATLGVFFSTDLFTTFVFFEIMSFTSYMWVAQEETGKALRAAGTYLAVAVIGGMVMLMGLFLVYYELGTLDFSNMHEAAASSGNPNILFAAGICMLIGFGAKAGAAPLHIWLPKAHPVAPAPASALLSGILTKTGIFGVLVLTTNLFWADIIWGKLILIIGTVTMLAGAVLAVFSVDFKRTLACSSMSQIGFILIGIGMQCLLGEEKASAVFGTFLHMANHSLIKLLLFMLAGVIYHNTHELNLNRIRGFGRRKPGLMLCFLTGGLAIAGIPLFGGYISKTLLHESILEYADAGWMKPVEMIFLFSGGLTLAYMTKLFIAVFVEKNQDASLQQSYDQRKKYMNWQSGFALYVSAAVLLVWGLFPHTVMERVAGAASAFMRLEHPAETVNYFALHNLKGALITLLVACAVYIGFIRPVLMDSHEEYVDRWPGWLDLENVVYRPILLGALPFIGGVFSRVFDSLVDGGIVLLRKTIYRDSPLPRIRERGGLLTELGGRLLEMIQSVQIRLGAKKEEDRKDYTAILEKKYVEFMEGGTIIERSLSFGLFLFGIGFLFTLIYLLFF